MIRFFIIILFFPVVTYSQVILPKFPVDSTTMLVTYQQTDVVTGAKKDKLSAVLRHWSMSDLNLRDISILKDNGDTTILNGTASLVGMYTYSVYGYLAKINYLVYFKVSITCLSEKYNVVLKNFLLGLSNENLPVEYFFKLSVPGQKQNANDALAEVYKMYSQQLYDMNATINNSLKRLSKQIEKAKNRGELY